MENHRRKSIRLKDYDYSRNGAYFVTIVTHHRVNYFGEIIAGEMNLNPPGDMINKWRIELPIKFPELYLDEYVIMPNHFHGILVNVGVDLRVEPDQHVDSNNQGGYGGPPLPKIIQWFKTMTTNSYIIGVKTLSWSRFDGSIWQRNYYDRIIRNDRELDAIRLYIQANPQNWLKDKEFSG
jgi:putative transposase